MGDMHNLSQAETARLIKQQYFSPLTHSKLRLLALATRAVVQWTADNARRAPGFSGVTIRHGPVAYDVPNQAQKNPPPPPRSRASDPHVTAAAAAAPAPEDSKGTTRVTVTPRPFHPAEVGEMGTLPGRTELMSVGSKRHCNFCHKPKASAEALTKCEGCGVMRYCSDRCKEADRPRHVEEEEECQRLRRQRTTCAVCGAKEGEGSAPLKRCGRCHIVRYCSVQHQKQDWKAGHKKVCRAPEYDSLPDD
jgi:hypothetical protein